MTVYGKLLQSKGNADLLFGDAVHNSNVYTGSSGQSLYKAAVLVRQGLSTPLSSPESLYLRFAYPLPIMVADVQHHVRV